METEQPKRHDGSDEPKREDGAGVTCVASQTFNNIVGVLALVAAVAIGAYLYNIFLG